MAILTPSLTIPEQTELAALARVQTELAAFVRVKGQY